MKKYKVFGKLSFSVDTDDKLCEVINNLHLNGHRVKLNYGNTETGKSWFEVYDTIGTIGRSTGINKIPLLIKTTRSIGGGEISVNSILKITDLTTNRVIYVHERFQPSKIDIVIEEGMEFPYKIFVDDKLFTKHRTKQSAKMMYNKII